MELQRLIDGEYLGLNVTDFIEMFNGSFPVVVHRPGVAPMEVPPGAQVVLITVYTISIILALFGNTAVIVVLAVVQRSRTELSVFLINLAVADLSMATFCMPFTFTQLMLGRWLFGDFVCRLATFMQVASVGVSIFTNMAIGIDR